MALFINGVGQDTFNMNGVSIDNLYVDNVLVWSSYVNSKPVIRRIGSDSVTVTEGNTYIDQGATALDTEDGDITLDIVTVNPVDTDMIGNYTVTYNVTDSEGLAADEVTRAVEVRVQPPITEDPPVYIMIEQLEVPGDGFSYLFNSADSGEQFNGKLLTSTDTAWSPTAQEYPEDGTIDFGTNKADTQWVMPANELLTFTFIDSVVMDISYRMISLVPQGDGTTANVLYDGVLDPIDTGLLYTPPLTTFVLDSDTFYTQIPRIPTCVVTMSQYTFGAGDTALVTLDFNVDTSWVSGSAGEFTAENGTLGEFTQVSKRKYTLVFTPTEDVSDDTNIITVHALDGSFGNPYQDAWGNECTTNFYSLNYIVNTASSVFGEELLNDVTITGISGDGTWSTNQAAPSYVTFNQPTVSLYAEASGNCQLRQIDVSVPQDGTYRMGANVTTINESGLGLQLHAFSLVGGDIVLPLTVPGWYYSNIELTAGTGVIYWILPDDGATITDVIISEVTLKRVLDVTPPLGDEVLGDPGMDGAINDGVWTKGIAGTSTVNMTGGECTMVVNPGDNCQLRQLDVSITSGVTYKLGINISDVVLDGAGIYFYSSRMTSGGDIFYPTTAGWYYKDVVFDETVTYDILYVIVDKLSGAAEYVLTDITMKEVL